ncbi:MAG: U32 family peptidase [Oscillospiraceae bacterium]|nr:U32 family peptidase [Oscillospiraceae bacterium]
MPELLSPAGNFESLKMAVLYGADAVYLGAKNTGEKSAFSMRAAPENFTFEELTEAVDFAHAHGVKIYLTCNTVPTNEEAENFPAFVQNAAKTGIDAVIVADLGVLEAVKTHAPLLDIHVSTQAGVMNYAAANAFYKLGAKRVILARETSIAEIAEIRKKTPLELELEAFVHGAMCVSFSGRCLLSKYLVNRDANRGECAQPCRWGYYLMEEKRAGQFYKIEEAEGGVSDAPKGTFILNAKDLCMIEHLDKLKEAGISSFKIEGRAKSAYYTAVITNAYRAALNALKSNLPVPEWAKREVLTVSHRAYSTGFYLGDEPEQFYEDSGYVREYDFIGVVNDFCNTESPLQGIADITQRNYFTVDDEIEVVEPCKSELYSLLPIPPKKLTVKSLTNEKGERVEIANKATERLFLETDVDLKPFSVLRKKTK